MLLSNHYNLQIMRLNSRKIIIYIGIAILLIIIIATRCLDFFFFFNEDNRRYTIGTFSGIGHYRGTIYKFNSLVSNKNGRVKNLIK